MAGRMAGKMRWILTIWQGDEDGIPSYMNAKQGPPT
jgi:hypothetical protein